MTTHDVHSALDDRSPGQPLPAGVQRELAAESGADLAGVRVHADGHAAALAANVQADAFTRGDDIYFATRKYAPTTGDGRKLLRHEVGHVLQQRRGEVTTYAGRLVPPDHPSETQAASGEALDGAPAKRSSRGQIAIQRQRSSLESTGRDFRQEALDSAQSAVLTEAAFGIGRQDPVWAKLGGLWMKDLLQVLSSLGLTGVEALGRHVDESHGGFATRLRLAIDAATMRLSSVEVSQIDPAFFTRLEALPPDQRKEISEFLVGSLPQAGRVVTTPRLARGTGEPLYRIHDATARVVQPTRPPLSTEIADVLPPPRTPFEARAFKRWEYFARARHPEKFQIIKDKTSGGIIGFLSDEGSGGVWIYDIEGKSTIIREKALEKPIVDPLDFVPFELLGSLAAKTASVVERGVAQAAFRDLATEGAEVAAKELADEATKTLSKETTVAAAAARHPTTPPEFQLPPYRPKGQTPTVARNVASYGESVVEPEVLENFLPKARQASAKAAGFDAFEGVKYVSVGATRAKDGTLVVEESISGGSWISIKGVSKPEAKLIEDNVHTAMEKAAEALKKVRANALERTGEGFAYRTIYAGDPDKITIFLRLEEGAVTPDLVRAAENAIAQSGYKTELPPVYFTIVGH